MDFTKPITRKELSSVAVKLFESLARANALPTLNNPFIDTNDGYVLKAYNLGITYGTSDNEFSPNDQITREQMATMLARALNRAGINTGLNLNIVSKFSDDMLFNEWGREPIYFMAEKGIIKGVGENRFDSLGNAKIEESIAISVRCEEILK